MAATANCTTISASSICFRPISPFSSFSSPSRFPPQFFRFPKPTAISTCSSSAANSPILNKLPGTKYLRSFIAAAATEEEGEETLVPEGEPEGGEETSSTPPPPPPPPTDTTDQTVSVTVSPSDVLTMFFQADGTMNETAIPAVTKALEEAEGITDLRVQILEGIASVELAKQTTVQATGVASSLVEIIQSKGFKLQTLNLSFQDEEDFI